MLQRYRLFAAVILLLPKYRYTSPFLSSSSSFFHSPSSSIPPSDLPLQPLLLHRRNIGTLRCTVCRYTNTEWHVPCHQSVDTRAQTGGTYRSTRLSVHGPPATRRYRQKPTVGSRLREKLTVGGRLREKSTVGGRLREKSTVGDRLRKKRGRKRRGKEEKRRGEEIIQCRPRPRAIATRGSPTRHRRPPVARTRGRFFSRARRRNVSSRGEKD
ncbi:hypothetical protein BHM03_00003428 [Ensete ventricosum]|nr:hypothetical protein BHM03_00003428 [Ensete ventricosum]